MNAVRILVVEDEAIIAKDIELKLIRMGYSVCGVAGSAQEAVQRADAHKPDLILMDILLEGETDGIQAAEAIHSHLSTPLIYITAHADDATLRRARMTEPYGYIVKPIDFRELHSTIEMALYKYKTDSMLRIQHELAVDMGLMTEMEPVLGRVLDALVQVEGVDFGGVYLMPDEASGGLLSTRGISHEAVESAARALFGSALVSSIVSGHPLYGPCSDFATLCDVFNYCSTGEEGLAILPLNANGTTIGVLVLGLRAWNTLPMQVQKMFEAVSAQLGGVVARIRAQDENRRQLEKMMVFRAIDEAITSNQDLRTVIEIVVKQVMTGLKADAAAILLLNPFSNTLEYTAFKGLHGTPPRNARIQPEKYFNEEVISPGLIMHWPDEQANDLWQSVGWISAEGFQSFYGVPLISKNKIRGVLEVFHRRPFQGSIEWVDFMMALAGQAAIAVDNANMLEQLQGANMELVQAYNATIAGWSRALELRDQETEGHSQKVTELTIRMARVLSVPEEEMIHLQRGALLHDIGKMGIPDAILLKPGPLTETEWKTMQMHPRYAYELLSGIPFLQKALEIPFAHHEKWDGHGYPRGLKGEEIPLAARIFAIVDVWDALRSDRPYHKAWSDKDALAYIKEQSGKMFDPRIAEVFFKLYEDGLI